MNDSTSTEARLHAVFSARLNDAPEATGAMFARTMQALEAEPEQHTQPFQIAAASWRALGIRARWAVACAIVIVAGTLSVESLQLAHRDGSGAPSAPYAVTAQDRTLAKAAPAAAPPMMAAKINAARVSQAMAPRDSAERAPQIARTGEMNVVVRDVAVALSAIRTLTARESGSVTSLQDVTPDDPAQPHNAQVALAIPSGRLDAVMDAIAATGAVKSRTTKGEDIATSIVDTSARLRNLRREERDLLKIMDRGGRTSDVLEVQTHVSDVRGQIETLDAQVASMKHRVATATLDVTLTQDRPQHGAVIPSSGARLDAMWQAALRSAGDAALALLGLGLWTIAFSPFWIVAILVVLFCVRRGRKRSAI